MEIIIYITDVNLVNLQNHESSSASQRTKDPTPPTNPNPGPEDNLFFSPLYINIYN